MTPASLIPAATAAEFTAARDLFVQYASQLGVDLCFQGFEAELNALDSMYGPPAGRLILARRDGQFVGCVGVRSLSDGVCEMKRLYVQLTERGGGLGQRLAQAAIEAARHMGYRKMVLDTLASMGAARALYARLGFVPIPAYYSNPIPDAAYLALELSR
jgi:ribosomal protein S18 acetylase RimI-like enzyme